MSQYELYLTYVIGEESKIIHVVVEAANERDANLIAVKAIIEELKIHQISIKKLTTPFVNP